MNIPKYFLALFLQIHDSNHMLLQHCTKCIHDISGLQIHDLEELGINCSIKINSSYFRNLKCKPTVLSKTKVHDYGVVIVAH